jgi:hypothetical protein
LALDREELVAMMQDLLASFATKMDLKAALARPCERLLGASTSPPVACAPSVFTATPEDL